MVACKCINCDKIFGVKSAYYQRTRKFCSKKCSNYFNDLAFKNGHTPLGRALTGHTTTDETKNKIREGNTGKKMSEESRLIMSKKRQLSNNANWRGGISFEKYPREWNEKLRTLVRERDRYTCQLCGEKQGDKALCVHHIDYNKHNCSPDNLISLCHLCHIKTNYKRPNWNSFFVSIKKLKEQLIDSIRTGVLNIDI